MPMKKDDPNYDRYRWTASWRHHRRNYNKYVQQIQTLQRKAQKQQAKMFEFEDKLYDIGVNTNDL